MHVNSFWFAKFFAIKALMFTDDMVPNPFQVSFTLILTIGIKKGLKCSGVKKKGVTKHAVISLGTEISSILSSAHRYSPGPECKRNRAKLSV